MNLKQIVLFILIFSSLAFAYVCEDETDQTNIPCDVITPSMSCLNYTYNVTSTASGTLVQSGNLTAVGDGTYKFQFDQTYGTYNIFVCENSSIFASITVGDFGAEDYPTWGLLILIIFVWGIFLLSLYLESRDTDGAYIITMVAAFIMLCISIYIIRNGLMELDTSLTNAIAILHFAVGGFFLVYTPWKRYNFNW